MLHRHVRPGAQLLPAQGSPTCPGRPPGNGNTADETTGTDSIGVEDGDAVGDADGVAVGDADGEGGSGPIIFKHVEDEEEMVSH